MPQVVGVPREIKVQEYRVGLTPDAVAELTRRGVEVWVERGAGTGAGYSDERYQAVGAHLGDVDDVWTRASLIVKVKEPQAQERVRLRRDQVLFTYLHLAPDPVQTRDLMSSGALCIAYETVTDRLGRLPLLTPMSEIAGRLSIQVGALALSSPQGGRGVLLAGVPGVLPARVLILGGGVVGRNAARVALGMGADVTVIDRAIPVLQELDALFRGRVRTQYATASALEAVLPSTDLLIGAVLIPGAAAPRLMTRQLLRSMPQGAAFVDVAIDQGGCSETSRVTTHDQPTYREEGVVHYCVANMPGSVARTATQALVNATLPFVVALAEDPLAACRSDPGLRAGINIYDGKLVNRGVGEAQHLEVSAIEDILR